MPDRVESAMARGQAADRRLVRERDEAAATAIRLRGERDEARAEAERLREALRGAMVGARALAVNCAKSSDMERAAVMAERMATMIADEARAALAGEEAGDG